MRHVLSLEMASFISFPFLFLPLFGSVRLIVPFNLVYLFSLFLFFVEVLFSLSIKDIVNLFSIPNSRYFRMAWRAGSLESCDMGLCVWPREPAAWRNVCYTIMLQ